MSIVHICGRIGRDAEVRKVNDQDVANFSVAENIGFGDNKKTQWWSCALWGTRAAKLEPWLTKGSAITVCGEVTVREYDGKDGNRKWELSCRVLDVTLQGSPERGGAERAEPSSAKPPVDTSARRAANSGPSTVPGSGGAEDFGDDIPFAFASPLLAGLLAVAAGAHYAVSYVA